MLMTFAYHYMLYAIAPTSESLVWSFVITDGEKLCLTPIAGQFLNEPRFIFEESRTVEVRVSLPLLLDGPFISRSHRFPLDDSIRIIVH